MNETPIDNAPLPADLRDTAIGWFVRRRGENAPDHEDAFIAWHGASPLHQRAYIWAENHFAEAAIVKLSSRHGTIQPSPRPHHFYGRAAFALAATLALVIGVAGYLLVPRQVLPAAAPTIALASQAGQIRVFTLPDGSRVTLDAYSHALVHIGGRERRFTLQSGRARIAIASNSTPFVASIASGRVTSSQGILDLDFVGTYGARVALLDGHAALSAARASTAYIRPSHMLIKGQALSYSATRFDPAPAPASDVDERDWPQGWLDFRAVPLSELVARTNRYGPPVIVLDNSRLGTLRISGRFKVTDPARIAARVADVFSLAVTHRPDGIHLDEK
ncbi:FecR family protein [Novosphingobium sp. 9]|uniref:FecR family protein n=1 Tax=Novosphingobium sp. 9 TaxID=2025349 RepID=UPI0021B5637E|nr:DUF4880 domain-containing protein [Novosphingobium sp. 9]